ncbi:hypothetical protein [Ottowia thiooxydans]|uniref:hypothetical protein n=1 Tax=Ottowia thiooxydans TaxID=219182 RepID=UPI00041E5063|nr:hypothetical protein [Ottowia thiooxydans]
MTDYARDDTPSQRLSRFYFWLDERKYTEMLELLELDSIWHRQGKILKGRAQILEALQSRPESKKVRHIITNAFWDASSSGTCTAFAYQTVYLQAPGEPGLPATPTYASKISAIKADMRHSERGWRIAELSSAVAMNLVP